jgi:hypothetical protein
MLGPMQATLDQFMDVKLTCPYCGWNLNGLNAISKLKLSISGLSLNYLLKFLCDACIFNA